MARSSLLFDTNMEFARDMKLSWIIDGRWGKSMPRELAKRMTSIDTSGATIVLPATYPLIIAMPLGLIFCGVAFEFRRRHPLCRPVWDVAFSLGSVVAALSQGMTLGAILQGISVENDAYAGGWLDWLSPFSMLAGLASVAGYALLGATWLIWKTEGSRIRISERSNSFRRTV